MEPIRGRGRLPDVNRSFASDPPTVLGALPEHRPRRSGPRPDEIGAATSNQAAMNQDLSGPTASNKAELVALRSFEEFYGAERDRIARAVSLALGDGDLGAEATDEAFSRAYPRWSSIAAGNPAGWVYRVALNWALSFLRRHRRRAGGSIYQPGVARRVEDAAGPWTEPMVEPAVNTALAALDPKHRSVVVCRHLLGWSVAETATALRLREGTVKSRLSRANQILQTHLHHLRPEELR